MINLDKNKQVTDSSYLFSSQLILICLIDVEKLKSSYFSFFFYQYYLILLKGELVNYTRELRTLISELTDKAFHYHDNMCLFTLKGR